MTATAPASPTVILRSAAASLVLAAVWFALAWRSPGSTHHFAPFVVAAAWGYLAVPVDRRSAIAAAAAGVAAALATLTALGVADRLGGPTLWGTRPSWPELAGFSLLGGALTLVRARRHLLG